MLFVSGLVSATVLSSCASSPVPNVKVYREIPFKDAPEAVFVETKSHKEGLITAQQWLSIREVVVCVDDNGWATIKQGWLAACRMAGPDCDVMVNSVDQLVRKLDGIAKTVIQGQKP